MTYIWTDTATIQNYLSAGSRITIGEQVSEDTAMLFENAAVDEISTILSAAWDGIYDLDSSTASRTLKWMAAKLTAAAIATTQVGGAVANLPEWAKTYRTDVIGQADRMVVNYETVRMPPSCVVRDDLDLGELLMKIKLRSGMAVTDV